MSDWNFLKKTEFRVTTIIAIILTFCGGFLAGHSYVINGDFTELQNKYDLLYSSYNKLITQNSQGNIVTQNQQGNNLLVNQEKPARKLEMKLKKEIDSILVQYQVKKVIVTYLSANSEVYNFSNEIIEYLKQKEYEVTWNSITPFGGKMEGISVKVDEGILNLFIGERI